MYFLSLSATDPGHHFAGCNFGQYIMRHHKNISLSTASASFSGSGELDEFESSFSGSNADAGELQYFMWTLSHRLCSRQVYSGRIYQVTM